MSSSREVRVVRNYSFSMTFGSPTRTYFLSGSAGGMVASVVEKFLGKFRVSV